MSAPSRPRLTTRGRRQFGHREIIAIVPAAQQQLELFEAEGLSRAQWHALIDRPPAIDRDDDITTLVIAMLEEQAEAALKPPAPSRRSAAKQRQKERA
jgi:hypothetical protein